MTEPTKPKARILRVEEAFWEQPPGHFEAFSKMLVHPTNADTRYFDFRISSYQPKGYAEVHVHEIAENVYYILQGKGIVELDGERHLVEPHMVIHIPPGVRHGIFNTGLEDLVFIVVASPPGDMPEVRPSRGAQP
ncbi:MAG: cupin domain-containing protein [Candidatus Methylomirabilota bacterium]|jgi:mannose-6-phosphate isomerase-like protein (cupin superfamily)